MIGEVSNGAGRNHSIHAIREIIVPDDALLPRLMSGEVRVSEL